MWATTSAKPTGTYNPTAGNSCKSGDGRMLFINGHLSTFVILFQQIHFWQFYLNSYQFLLCLFGPPNISQTWRILWPVIAIRLKFAASWIIRVWTYNEFPRSIRFDPESNTYILGEYDALSTIRLRLQRFDIRFNDEAGPTKRDPASSKFVNHFSLCKWNRKRNKKKERK